MVMLAVVIRGQCFLFSFQNEKKTADFFIFEKVSKFEKISQMEIGEMKFEKTSIYRYTLLSFSRSKKLSFGDNK